MKKLLSIVISIILIFSLSLSTFARVDYSENGDTFYWDCDTDDFEFIELEGMRFYKIYDNFNFINNHGFFIAYNSSSGLTSFDYEYIVSNSDDYELYILVPFYVNGLDNPVYGVLVPESFDYDGVSVSPGFYTTIDYVLSIELHSSLFNGFKPVEPDIPTDPDTPTTETIVVKEDRPMFDIPLSDYSVTEGLLLLLFVVTVLNNIFKQHLKGN